MIKKIICQKNKFFQVKHKFLKKRNFVRPLTNLSVREIELLDHKTKVVL